ncbi:MAG: amino acid permease [Clostridiales bacterium]|nr:amino acid permease [Clostridiales bacterium]
MKNNKKMTLLMCMAMSVGSIIGGGIFAVSPMAMRRLGPAVCLAFILTVVFMVIKMLPQVVMSSALPASGANYMHLTRLIHPGFGVVEALNVLLIGTMNIAMMSFAFSKYFVVLFPSANGRLVAILCCLFFAVMANFGARISGRIQYILVGILMLALGVYIFVGFGHISPVNVTLADVLFPTFEVGAMWAVVGILNNVLMGGNVVMGFADQIENPSRTIPIAFIGGTVITALIYAIFAYVTIGVVPSESVQNIGDVAETFLSPALLTFFITGGALLAIVTSINGTLMMYSHTHFMVAKDGLYPKFMSKTNKYGAPYGTIWVHTAITLAALFTSLNLRDIVSITAAPGLILGPVAYLPIFVVMKKFPNCYKSAFLKIPHKVICAVAILATVLSVTAGGNVLAGMTSNQWIGMLVYYGTATILIVTRLKYVKYKTGEDIVQRMKQPHEAWEEREKAHEVWEEKANA